MKETQVTGPRLIMAQTELNGLLELKQEVDARVAVLQQMLKPSRPAHPAHSSLLPVRSTETKKRPLDQAVRARIAAAQKRRWAEHRKRAALAAAEANKPKPATKTKTMASKAAAPKVMAASQPAVDMSDLTG